LLQIVIAECNIFVLSLWWLRTVLEHAG